LVIEDIEILRDLKYYKIQIIISNAVKPQQNKRRFKLLQFKVIV